LEHRSKVGVGIPTAMSASVEKVDPGFSKKRCENKRLQRRAAAEKKRPV
jgi:hypothetical protein